LGQDALASGAPTILGGQAADALAGAAAGQGSASPQSLANRAVFAALAQSPSGGASAEELSAGNDSGAPADLWWLQYGQG
jgi:hypothetical protein